MSRSKVERFLLGDVDAEFDQPRDRMHCYFSSGDGLLLFPMLRQRIRVIAQIIDGDDDASIERSQKVIDEASD